MPMGEGHGTVLIDFGAWSGVHAIDYENCHAALICLQTATGVGRFSISGEIYGNEISFPSNWHAPNFF